MFHSYSLCLFMSNIWGLKNLVEWSSFLSTEKLTWDQINWIWAGSLIYVSPVRIWIHPFTRIWIADLGFEPAVGSWTTSPIYPSTWLCSNFWTNNVKFIQIDLILRWSDQNRRFQSSPGRGYATVQESIWEGASYYLIQRRVSRLLASGDIGAAGQNPSSQVHRTSISGSREVAKFAS